MGWIRRLRGTVRDSALEDDLDDEVRFHLDQRIAGYVRDGLTEGDARRVALRRFGHPTLMKERTRDMDTLPWLHDLGQDLRYARRLLRQSPGFTAVALLSLGLGIGANTAVFSVINALMLRVLPVSRPEALVRLVSPGEDYGFSYPDFQIFRDRTTTFSSISAMAVVDRSNITVSGASDQDGAPATVELVSGTYFTTLGVQPAAGRLLTAADDGVPGGHPVAVISDRCWTRRFARASDAIGRTIGFNGTTYLVVGLAPPHFDGEWVGRPVDLWIPIAMQSQAMTERPDLLTNPGPPWLRIMARLKPGVARLQAQAEVQGIYLQTLTTKNLSPAQRTGALEALPILEPGANGFSLQRQTLAQPITIVLVVAALVLLIACANVANLTLARSMARSREVGVRLALGAGRARIVRQFLTESSVLAVLGCAVGSALAWWGTRTFAAFSRTTLATDLDLRPDARVLAFAVALSLVAGLGCGLVPAFQVSRASFSRLLVGRGTDATGKLPLGRALVVVQVALSLVLFVGAGLFVRSLQNLRSQDLGIDREHLLLVWTAPAQAGRRGPTLVPLFQAVQERISSLPGVLSASPSTHGVLSGFYGSGGPRVTVEGRPSAPSADAGAVWNVVAPRFFVTVGMRLVAGRDFTDHDVAKSPQVAIVNETMARSFFGDRNPIGQRFAKGFKDDLWEVVGVVSDAKDNTPGEPLRPMFYLSYRQDVGHLDNMCLAVRTAGNPANFASEIRQELRALDPRLPVLQIASVGQQLDAQLGQARLVTTLSTGFSLIAGILTCVGLYGLMAYVIARRTSEIGLRMALGAARSQVLARVLLETVWLTLVGITLGVPLTLTATRAVAGRLFGIGAGDVLTLAGASFLMVGVAAIAGFVPARRAAVIDPMIALRRNE